MADLFDSVVSKTKIWRGAGRIVYAASGTSFPGRIESIINPSTFALNASWSDIGGTSEDGVTVTREFEGRDGVMVDQLPYPLFAGDPHNWKMSCGFELLETDIAKLQIAWELPASVALTSGSGPTDYGIAQTKVGLSAPNSLTQRLLAVIQEQPEDADLRVIAFRKAQLTPEATELVMASSDPSGLAITFDCQADSDIDDDSDPFGAVFEETTSS